MLELLEGQAGEAWESYEMNAVLKMKEHRAA
jgi:hypothetical protein